MPNNQIEIRVIDAHFPQREAHAAALVRAVSDLTLCCTGIRLSRADEDFLQRSWIGTLQQWLLLRVADDVATAIRGLSLAALNQRGVIREERRLVMLQAEINCNTSVQALWNEFQNALHRYESQLQKSSQDFLKSIVKVEAVGRVDKKTLRIVLMRHLSLFTIRDRVEHVPAKDFLNQLCYELIPREFLKDGVLLATKEYQAEKAAAGNYNPEDAVSRKSRRRLKALLAALEHLPAIVADDALSKLVLGIRRLLLLEDSAYEKIFRPKNEKVIRQIDNYLRLCDGKAFYAAAILAQLRVEEMGPKDEYVERILSCLRGTCLTWVDPKLAA